MLNADQAYQQARISLVQAQADRFTDTAALFQALGGGWWHRPELVERRQCPLRHARDAPRRLRCCACSPAARRRRTTDAGATNAVANVRLTKAQRHTSSSTRSCRSAIAQHIEAPGTVDFDNDQATAVVSPFSGPVTRIFVALGPARGQGPAAGGGRFRRFRHCRRRLSQGAVGRGQRAAGCSSGQRPGRAQRHLRARSGPGRNRCGKRRGRPGSRRCRRWASIGTIASIRESGAVSGIIRAPVSGIVVEKQITPGQLLQAGSSAAFTVANLSQVWVMAQIAPSDLAAVGLHDAATIDPGNGTGPFHGTVDNIGASVDPDTRAVVARIVAPNPGDLLKKQMYVDVSIESGRVSTGLLVPVSAVLRDDREPAVRLCRPARRQLRPPPRHARLSRQPELRRDERARERRPGGGRTARSSSSSCRANERAIRRRARRRRDRLLVHQPDRRPQPRAAFPRRRCDGAADRRRHPRAGSGCRSMPIPICRRRWSRSSPNGPATPPRKSNG